MARGPRVVAVLLMIATTSIPGLGFAVNVETLLMPGKLSAAHQKIEQDCTQCHDRANRERQSELCSTCHKDVAADIRSRRGFHGRLENIERVQCSACHTEHHGRDADIVQLSAMTVDHAATDFPLAGSHVSVPCEGCHDARRKYREAPTTCIACHRSADAHAGKLGTDCAQCHTPDLWSRTRFAHRSTGYDLRGRHASLACASCHAGNRYADTPRQCVSCHAPDDAHAGSRGPDCASCHDENRWKAVAFDHARETGFALLGAHASVECVGCHRSNDVHAPLSRDCVGCHRGDDVHASRFGAGCQKCHSTTEWQTTLFDHARDAKLALDGRHTRLDCHSCHTASVESQKLGSDCLACHRPNDVHGGKLGTGCANCHGSESWSKAIRFDHDFTSFPLVGLHVTVPCVQCHETREFRGTHSACIGCHERDDRHQGSLGRQCESCHTPNDWSVWQFDHAMVTGFELSGAHARAGCGDCHRKPPDAVKLATDCASCHSKDDVHQGQFGRQCERCHVTTTFKGARTR